MWAPTAGERVTTVNRVRLRGQAGLDPLAAQLRAARAIEHAADRVPLPAGAILCVRHLRDPRPGQVSLSALQPPPEPWARAVEDRLADLVRRAARPARGTVETAAESVLFDDRAQMLACLAADWCRGMIAGRWWWRALVGSSSDAEAVLRAWRRHPAHIAAAIEEVTRLGYASSFVERLSRIHTRALLDAVIEMHGLSPQLAFDPAPEWPTIMVGRASSTDTTAPVEAPPIDLGRVWRRSAPEACDVRLRIDQQLVLGVALTLRRQPVRARGTFFAAEVARWREQLFAAGTTASESAATTAAAMGWPDDDAPDTTTATTVVTPRATEADAAESVADARPDRRVTPTRHRFPESPNRVRPGHQRRGEIARVDRDSAAMVETDLGGLFYLLNVALALGLYGDFTAPRGRRLDLSIWRFVALIGEALLGGRHGRDPVWKLLRELAGPDERAMPETGGWRLAPAWLAAFPESRRWRWHAESGRLHVGHPAGFSILDVALAQDRPTADQLRDEVERYRDAARFRLVRGAAARRRNETPVGRWTRWQAAYIRARLARALNAPAARAGELLCRQKAHVRVSLTHLEVVFSLQDLPVAIRMSGLDRDPGWIPAADRIVSVSYV